MISLDHGQPWEKKEGGDPQLARWHRELASLDALIESLRSQQERYPRHIQVMYDAKIRELQAEQKDIVDMLLAVKKDQAERKRAEREVAYAILNHRSHVVSL